MDDHERYLFDLNGYLAIPAAYAWGAAFYDRDRWPDLTDRQRAILESPNARYGGRRTA